MQKLVLSFISVALFVVLTGCYTETNIAHTRNAPASSASTIPSVCLAKGRLAEQKGDASGAVLWYLRGGQWNAGGRFSNFAEPGALAEPEETSRFLCILGFADAGHKLILQQPDVHMDGHPLHIALSNAVLVIESYQTKYPKGYAGLTGQQLNAIYQRALAINEQDEAFQHGAAREAAAEHQATLESMAAVGSAAAMVAGAATEQGPAVSAPVIPPTSVRRASGNGPGGAYVVNPNGAASNPGVIANGGSMYDNYMQAAQAYRNAAAQETDPTKRASYLQSAQQMEAEAAKLR